MVPLHMSIPWHKNEDRNLHIVRNRIIPENTANRESLSPHNAVKDGLRADFLPMIMAQIFNKSLSSAYNELIPDPVLSKN